MKPHQLMPLLLLAAAACAEDQGALGNTSISPECNATDFACVANGLDGPLAVGGVLPLSIDADTLGTAGDAMTLLSADPTVIKAAGTEVVGMAPGVASLVMLSGGRAIDFLHLYVVAPTRIGVHRVDTGIDRAEMTEPIELLVGDDLVIEAEAYRDSQRLLGHGTTTWTPTGSAITALHDGAPSRRRIVARAAGEADIAVSAFGFSKTLHITVLP